MIKFNKPLKLLPDDEAETPTGNSVRDNAQIIGWYNYNLAKKERILSNEDWIQFLYFMCEFNNADIDNIPTNILFGHQPWPHDNPLCEKLAYHLFDYAEGQLNWDTGEQSSDTSAYVGYSSRNDSGPEYNSD